MTVSTQPFGEYLRGRRRAARLSLRELAGAMGCSIVYVSDIERGKRPPPTDLRKLEAAAALLGENLRELRRRAVRDRGYVIIRVDGMGDTDLDLLLDRSCGDPQCRKLPPP